MRVLAIERRLSSCQAILKDAGEVINRPLVARQEWGPRRAMQVLLFPGGSSQSRV